MTDKFTKLLECARCVLMTIYRPKYQRSLHSSW